MKKYLTLILTAALALPAFSCGSESAGGNDTTTAAQTTSGETTAPAPTDGLPDKDMDEFELRINPVSYTHLTLPTK